MRNPSRRARRNRGFTLLELGIVLGVAAILAAAIAPDMIESMRNKMAEKAAQDVAMIHDAARWFFIDSGRSGGEYRWPGLQPGVTGCAAGTFVPENARSDLLLNGYIAGGDRNDPLQGVAKRFLNPWGRSYDLDAYEPPIAAAGTTPGCLFGVATSIPRELADAFISFLPQAGCNLNGLRPCLDDPAGLPANYVRCCSYVPKPGYEMWKNFCSGGKSIGVDGSGNLKCL